jgi:hypothetical protein
MEELNRNFELSHRPPSLAYLLYYFIMEFSYVCHLYKKIIFYHLPPH